MGSVCGILGMIAAVKCTVAVRARRSRHRASGARVGFERDKKARRRTTMVAVAPMPSSVNTTAPVGASLHAAWHHDGGLLSSRAQRSGYMQKSSSPRPARNTGGTGDGTGLGSTVTYGGGQSANRGAAIVGSASRGGAQADGGGCPSKSSTASGRGATSTSDRLLAGVIRMGNSPWTSSRLPQALALSGDVAGVGVGARPGPGRTRPPPAVPLSGRLRVGGLVEDWVMPTGSTAGAGVPSVPLI